MKTFKSDDEIRHWLHANNAEETLEKTLLADGHPHAFVGTLERFEEDGRLRLVTVYSIPLCLAGLQRHMDRESARDYFYYNIYGAQVGPYTPLWLETP